MDRVNGGNSGLVSSWAAPACTVAVLLLAVAVNQTAVHWRENVVDSHLFAYYGWCVSQGARPYLDFWDNKPPGIWWLNAAAFALFGEGQGGEVLICTSALLLSLVGFTVIARSAYQASLTFPAAVTGALLLTHLLYEGGANRTETFVVTCETLAVLGYVRWGLTGRWRWLVLGGLAAGAAPLFKQSGLAAVGACGIHLGWTQWRQRKPNSQRGLWFQPWLIGGSAFLVPPLASASVLWFQGALGEAWFAVGPFNRAYFAIGDATYLRIDKALRIYADVLGPLAGLFLVVLGGLVWGLARRGLHGPEQNKLPTRVGLFWAWFLLAGYLACVGPGRRGHHFMPALAPLGLLSLYPLHLLAGRRGLAARLTASPMALVGLVLFGVVLGGVTWEHGVRVQRCWRRKTEPWALEYAEKPGYVLQAEAIRRLTSADERIYVWGWSPGTYRYAYRLPASRFATLEKLGQVGRQAAFILVRAREDLQRSPPAVMVFSPADLENLETPFADWVWSRYRDLGLVGGMHVLVRKEAPTLPGGASSGSSRRP